MTDNLLPCPFCGERAHMHAVNGPYCGNFECALHLVSGFTLDAWNKRAWQAARTVPVEVFDSHCNYASFAGRVCNKCGRIHDGGKSVAVVGEPIYWIDPDDDANLSRIGRVGWSPLYGESPAADLARLREKAARLEREIDPERVPEGWRAVPVEPTDEMIDAGCDAADAYRVDIVRAYLAMMSVSPEA